MTSGNSSYRSNKRTLYDAFAPTFFLPRKRANHNEVQPQSNANSHTPSADSAESTIGPLSPDGGVAIDEEALSKLRSYGVLSCGDESNDDNSSTDGSHDDRISRGRSTGAKQIAEPLRPCEGRSEPKARRQFQPNHQHNTNKNGQTAALSYASSLSVFNHQRGRFVVEPGSSMTVYQPFRGLQSAQPLDSVMLNPRVGMAVEGGKLYLAQTLHHYYRKHIYCSHHGPVDGRPGHHRTGRKVHETGKVYREWFCTSQPKGEGHRIDNTEYIELAMVRLDRALFDRVLHEVIRQLRFRDCQPVARNHSPQSDDFDYHALLRYVDWQRVDKTVFTTILL